MADNVQVDNADLPDYNVSTDEAASGQVQRVKLTYSADGSDTHVTADAQGLKVQGAVSLSTSVVNVNASQAGNWVASIAGSINNNPLNVNASQAGTWTVQPGTNPWNVGIASYGGATTTLGQKAASASIPVVPPSDVTANVNVASQTFSGTQNINLASYGGAATTLGAKGAASSAPVVLANDTTVQVSLASQGTSSVAVSGTVTANQGTSNVTSQAWPIKPLRDISRTPLTFWVDDVAGISTEALATMNITKAGLSQAASTSYIVTAGKILRLCEFVMSTRASTATLQAARARVRQGNAATHSVLISVQAGVPAATINAVGINDADLAEGAIELPASTSLCISHVETQIASNTFSCCLIGYEYTA
jgi:hypothetical protein